MSEKYSEYSTILKTFKYLAFLIFAFSIAYLLSGVLDGSKEALSKSVSAGLLGIGAGAFLLYFGNKKRTITIYHDRIEYLKPKIDFEAKWDDVILVKSFQEISRKTENLVVMTNDERILSISTAFFDRDKLISAFRDIKNLLSNRDNITFEDDRQWGDNL